MTEPEYYRIPTASEFLQGGPNKKPKPRRVPRRRLHTNTPLARKLAIEYERMTGKTFPGGITNACIRRVYPGWSMRDAGAWSWELQCVEPVFRGPHEEMFPAAFGSQWPAKEALKNPDELIDIGDW